MKSVKGKQKLKMACGCGLAVMLCGCVAPGETFVQAAVWMDAYYAAQEAATRERLGLRPGEPLPVYGDGGLSDSYYEATARNDPSDISRALQGH